MGTSLIVLVVLLLVLWIGWKYFQRQRFLKQLDVSRILPEELSDRLSAGEDLFIVDLRNPSSAELEGVSAVIRISVEQLSTLRDEIPQDREIILVCD